MEGDSGSVQPGTKSRSQDCPYSVPRGCKWGGMRGRQWRDDYNHNHNRYDEMMTYRSYMNVSR